MKMNTRNSKIQILEFKGNIYEPINVCSDSLDNLCLFYCQNGLKALDNLNGEFAFILYDNKEKSFILCRDIVGTKTIYYSFLNNKFAASLSLKNLISSLGYTPSLNLRSIVAYLLFTFIPWPYTLFESIYQVPPGTILKVQNNNFTQRTLLNLDLENSFSICNNFLTIFDKAVRYRVPFQKKFGALLSGGIDTTILVSYLSKRLGLDFPVFTVGFSNPDFDESIYASRVANHLGLKHYILKLDRLELPKILVDIIQATEMPFWDSSAIPTLLIFQEAKQYVDIILTGDGPDQFFFGSNDYSNWIRRNYIFRPFPSFLRTILYFLFSNNYYDPFSNQFLNKLKKCLKFESFPFWKRFILNRSLISYDLAKLLFKDLDPQLIEELLIEMYERIFRNLNNFLDQMIFYDQKHFLVDDLMFKVNKMADKVNIEVRFPFLDFRFIKLANLIDSKKKIPGILNPNKKFLLKKCFSDFIPPFILNKPKQGFGIPFHQWLMDLKSFSYEILLSSKSINRGYFKKNVLERILNFYFSGKNLYFGGLIYALITLELWHILFIDKEVVT